MRRPQGLGYVQLPQKQWDKNSSYEAGLAFDDGVLIGSGKLVPLIGSQEASSTKFSNYEL